MNISDTINFHMLKHNVKIKQIAESLGVCRQVVYKWADGRSAPEFHNAIKLAKLLQFNLMDVEIK